MKNRFNRLSMGLPIFLTNTREGYIRTQEYISLYDILNKKSKKEVLTGVGEESKVVDSKWKKFLRFCRIGV